MAIASNNSGSSPGTTGAPSFVVVLVTSALTVLFMFLPWVNIPIANMVGAVTGANVVKSDYTVLDVYGLMSPALSAESAPLEMKAVVYGFMLLWVGSMALMAYGAFRCYRNGVGTFSVVGGLGAALAAILWFLAMRMISQSISSQTYVQAITNTLWPFATILAGIATAVLGFRMRGAIDRRPQPQPDNGANNVLPPPDRTILTPPGDGPDNAIINVQGSMMASCVCPSCGYTVEVAVPAQNCTVNITCGHCGRKFLREVRLRG